LYKALCWLVPKGSLADITFRKDCTWAPLSLVFAALLWTWSDLRPLMERFFSARKIIKHLFAEQQEPGGSYQAFIKLLGRWTAKLSGQLRAVFRQRMRESLPQRAWRLVRWLVFAVDGSCVDVPRTRANEARYSPKSKLSRAAQKCRHLRRCRRKRSRDARQRKANVPRIWLTTLWHVASGLPWAWRTGPSGSSERGHLQDMLGELPDGALVTTDAGFVGYHLWQLILAGGHQLLVRVGGNVRLLKKLGYARERAGIVYLWPDKAAAGQQPPLTLRLVVVHNGKHPIYLVTSVLDSTELTDAEAAKIYARRWGIELFYRNCKQTFERRKLRSTSPDHAQLELEWSLLGMWAMGLHSHCRLTKQGVPVQRISFAGVLRAYRTAMREYKSLPDPGERLMEILDKAIVDGYHRQNKASRDYPRKKQEQATGPPTITPATKHQIRAAACLRRESKKGLTA
jgi:hypothetical protein